MKKQIDKKQLRLSPVTIRQLRDSELATVAGGMTQTERACGAPSGG
jgi:hypothetical protein